MSGLSETERQVTNVIAPKQSADPGIGVTILAATTTAAHAAVPDAHFARYVYLAAEGDKIWVNFDADASGSPASADIVKGNAGGATFALGCVATNAIPIPNGARIAVRLSKGQHDWIKWQSDSTNAKLIIYPTTPARQRA